MNKKAFIVFKTFLVFVLFFSFSFSSSLAFNPSSLVNIYSNSDIEGRESIQVNSIRTTNYINFYVDQSWWNNQSQTNRFKIESFASTLSSEFEYNIYPKIKNVLPEISKLINFNDKLNVIITPMSGDIQGYIRQEDLRTKNQYPNSNEGKIIYLNAQNITNPNISNNILYAFFSHELMHILSYQEKNINRFVSEDTWMEELRSEYLPHFLGYNNKTDSYINFRLQNGINVSEANFINWSNTVGNYSLINLFAIYLNQRFSQDIFFETLKTHLTGIDSINYYLIKHGYTERFDDIYQDWIIANIINDCNISEKYCYKNFNININIPGNSFYLPINSDSVLSISDVSSNYQAKYQKILGGSDTLEFTFENPKNNKYRTIAYILTYADGRKKLDFFNYNGNPESKIIIKDYRKNYSNILVVPIFSGNQNDSNQIFKWHINSIKDRTTTTTQPIIQAPETQSRNEIIMKLQLQLIDLLKQLLAMLKTQRGI